MSQTPLAEGPTAELGAFVAKLRFDDLPAAVVAQAQDVILDAIGCAIGAWRDDPPKAEVMSKIVSTFKAAPVATVWGSRGLRSDAAIAALANGALANAADFDDTQKRPCCTPAPSSCRPPWPWPRSATCRDAP